MPGAGHRFTAKEDRLAKQIMREYLDRGYSTKRARAIGYATVNKIRDRTYFNSPTGLEISRQRKVKVGRKSFKI